MSAIHDHSEWLNELDELWMPRPQGLGLDYIKGVHRSVKKFSPRQGSLRQRLV